MPLRMLAVATIVTILASTTSDARAGDNRCPTARQIGLSPVVRVDAQVPAAKYRFNADTRELTAMFQHSRGEGTNHGTTLGLTRAGGYSLKAIDVQAYSVRKGGVHCHYIKSAHYALALSELTVWVASEYRRGGCQYQTIMQHENEHVRVNKAVVEKYAPILREELRKAIDRTYPIASTNGRISSQEWAAALTKVNNAIFRKMLDEREKGNARIDTGHSYAALAKRCQNW